MAVLYDTYPIATINMLNVSMRPDLIKVMKQFAPTANTFPQIWIAEKYVGGYTDLLKFVEHF